MTLHFEHIHHYPKIGDARLPYSIYFCAFGDQLFFLGLEAERLPDGDNLLGYIIVVETFRGYNRLNWLNGYWGSPLFSNSPDFIKQVIDPQVIHL